MRVNFLLLFTGVSVICMLLGMIATEKTDGGRRETDDKQQRRTVDAFKVRMNAFDAHVNNRTAGVVGDNRLSKGKGVALLDGVTSAVGGERTDPDLVFDIDVPKAGRYAIHTYAVTDAEGAALMKDAKTKFESLFIRIQIDDQRPTKRVVYVPWDRPLQHTGKFELTGGKQKLKIWLPRGVRLGYAEVSDYIPPAVPVKARNYRPSVVPPSAHPRLWVNQESLPLIKARLEIAENKPVWEKVRTSARTPFVFHLDPAEELSYNAELEKAAENKAFYYLMTGDKKIGREVVKLMVDYLSHVEFGNILDITREIGRAIYTGSLVYDWCYDLLTDAEKVSLRKHMIRLADDMEIGWPPFLQRVVNGHGNEAQVCRDLLSMSIAIYNEDPLPYQYCSYAILEELVPMRRFEYQSPRHNQGVNYGSYRFQWDLHAAWLFRRMTGTPVFDDNIRHVSKFWLYMRTPDGQMLRDGDQFSAGRPGEFYYWRADLMSFLSYTYGADRILKREFERYGGKIDSHPLFLLLNDPELRPVENLETLSLTMDFGPILGSMVARTGWDMGLNSSDVVAEIKGGGYHFGNHQHSDAGSIQLYYRGFQFGDLGVYKFYGTPYDYNFNKRSISHSMMLVVNPKEKFLDTESNDGGTRFNQRFPVSPEEVRSDPAFNNGKVRSADRGPWGAKPIFSYFSVDLTGAYSAKVGDYTRSFCFLNMEREDIPAVIILRDDITSSDRHFRKYWQLNTHNKPDITSGGFILSNKREQLIGRTHVEMLVPTAQDRQTDVYSGAAANSSFGLFYEPPLAIQQPEANGHRIMVSPKYQSHYDRFLTVFQVADGDTKPLPITHLQTTESDIICIADRVVSISNSKKLIEKGFILDIPSGEDYWIMLTGLKEGVWQVTDNTGRIVIKTPVLENRNALYLIAPGGRYEVAPTL